MSQTFNDLPILEQTKKALASANLTIPTPIQQLAIPKMIEGHDLIAQAQTGTGKTFAYAIPTVEKIDVKNNKIQSVILTPTRELALQVYKEIIKLISFYPEIKVIPIIGGESYQKQFTNLRRNPHIVVATPGRLIDHMERKTINLTNLTTLTFDEADEMLKMGFQEDIETILKETPNTRQTVLFSATIPPFVKKIATNYQKNPLTIKVEASSLTVENITQNYTLVKDKDKKQLLIRLIDYLEPKSAIIFANTKKAVDEITLFLQENNYSADSLHGDLKQSQRTYVMNNFRNNQTKFLVATDVAARGLDVDNVSVIFNYDIPQELEIYVHRIGRTARAGSKGIAYTFVTPRTTRFIQDIEKYANSKLFLKEIPTPEDIYSKQNFHFTNSLKKTIIKNINKSKNDNYEIINSLLLEGYREVDIINALIDDLKPATNKYNKIDAVTIKKETKRRNNFTTIFVNLGKNDRIMPDTLIKLLRKEYDVSARNIGEIKHFANETRFELNVKDIYIVTSNKRVMFKGKKLRFRIGRK